MTLRLFDTRRQGLVDFEPLVPGQVTMYVCGPTVQSSPHVGHLRSALVYDILTRWLEYSGHRVTLVRNITDIDDKVLVNAAELGDDWRALALRSEREFHAVYAAIGVRHPAHEPRATGHITHMITLIEKLIERGHAYASADGSGDVYFDTASWPDYGILTRQMTDTLEPEAGTTDGAKKDPRDFALWKGHKDGDPLTAAWPAPWGKGRPGWHIECSAMAVDYLGPAFDIHGGGLDLRFPHHENELAQSTSAGDAFARYWLHNGLVSIAGQKMSKSLGNSVFAQDLVSQARPIVVRYFLGQAHYRSTLELHGDALAEAASAFERIEAFVSRSRHEAGDVMPATGVPDAFATAMNDDIGVPAALAVIHDAVRAGNAAWDTGDTADARRITSEVLAMLTVLGLNPDAPTWASPSGDSAHARALDALVNRLLTERENARSAKDFSTSDRVRDDLAAAGITIDDTPSGPRWSIHGQ